MFAIGKLNKRIDLLKPTVTDDGYQESTTWAKDRSVWANVAWVSDREKYAAGAIGIETVLRVTVRKTSINHDWRIKYDGIEYEINGITPMIDKEHFIQLNCARVK